MMARLSLRGRSPATMNMARGYFQRKIWEKIQPKETPSCLIPSLLCIYQATWHLSDNPVMEILLCSKEAQLKPFTPHANMDATLLVDNSHHWWILQVASAHPVTCCCRLLRFVGSCWAKFETSHTFSHVKTDPTTPNILRPTMLGVVVVSVCTLSFKPQYPHQNSPDWSPYISFKN